MATLTKQRINRVVKKYVSPKNNPADFIAENSHYPNTDEPMLIHPFNQSVVKIRNNGTVDIFVSDNNGIRIDNKYKSINFIGNSIVERAQYIRSYIAKDLIQKIQGSWVIEAKNANIVTKEYTNIYSEKEVLVQSLKDIQINTNNNVYISSAKDIVASVVETAYINGKNVHVNTSKDVVINSAESTYANAKNAFINASENVNITAKKNINIKAVNANIELSNDGFIKSSRNLTLESNQNLYFKAKNIDMYVQQNFTAYAADYNWS